MSEDDDTAPENQPTAARRMMHADSVAAASEALDANLATALAVLPQPADERDRHKATTALLHRCLQDGSIAALFDRYPGLRHAAVSCLREGTVNQTGHGTEFSICIPGTCSAGAILYR